MREPTAITRRMSGSEELGKGKGLRSDVILYSSIIHWVEPHTDVKLTDSPSIRMKYAQQCALKSGLSAIRGTVLLTVWGMF